MVMGRRFFRYGELPLVLLALTDQRPMSGYELMADLRRLFAPHYRPSPGSIYPALDVLATEGLIVADGEDGSSAWRPTALGERTLEQRREDLAAVEARTGTRLQTGSALDAALARFGSRMRAVTGRVGVDEIEHRLERLAAEIEVAAGHDTERGSR
jgi:DNA-binding PadR family transcriptional regulator